jgi:cytochrome c553
MRGVILILAAWLGAAYAAPVPDTLARRLAPCLSCHGNTPAPAAGGPRDERRGDDRRYFPRIAGKPAGYLYNQLQNFRAGRRQYPLMTWMVEHLPDAYLHEIADFFSSQHLPYPPPAAPDAAPSVLERGRLLATKGDPTLKVPACMACHGQKLTGVAPAIPGLAGLPRDYVNAQFGAWRNKVRRAHAPDCMAAIAARLSLADVAAVSSWLAAQPVPQDASPAQSVARPLPLACGSSPD